MRVWKAFVNWYGRSQELARKVIIYPMQELSLRAASQFQHLQSLKGATQLVNEPLIVKCLDQLICRCEPSQLVKELEVDEIFVKCGRI